MCYTTLGIVGRAIDTAQMLQRRPIYQSLRHVICERSIQYHQELAQNHKLYRKTQPRFISIYIRHINQPKAQLPTILDQCHTRQKSTATESDEKDKEKANSSKKNESVDSDRAKRFVQSIFQMIIDQKDRILRIQSDNRFREEWKEAVKEVFGTKSKRSVDEALSSARTTSTGTQRSESNTDNEETVEYTGTTALVHVKDEDSAWRKISARFREAPIIQSILDAAKTAAKTKAGKKVERTAKQAKEKIDDAREEVLEFWETSQNPWIYRLSSLYDGFFGETPMGVAIKEIRRAEPDFLVEKWKEDIAEFVLPGVLEAFLKGNSRDLKKWFGEAAYSRVNAAIRERKSDGLVMDPSVLGIDNVDVIEASAEDKQAPIILLRFRSQQINCIRNREGEVVEGAEDEVLAYFYIFAFQRVYDEQKERLQWRIVDIHMQRGGRYY